MKKQCVVLYAILSCIFADDSGSSCETSESASSDHLALLFNPKTKIHSAFNKTAAVVPVLDYSYNISSLYNGKTGAALVFNYETGISAFIPPGSGITWYSEKKSFEDYFENLPPQIKLYQYAETHGIRFDASSITEEISDEIVNVLTPMSQDYKSRCEGLANYLHVSKITSDCLKTSMSTFSSVAGLFNTPFRGDFKWLIGMYQGIGGIFEEVEGGMAILEKNNVTLDMGKIFTEKSGFHVLMYFLEQLHEKLDVGKIFGKALNCQNRFLTLLAKLSGEVDYGFDGYVYVIAEIVKFKFNESSPQNVENALIKYSSNPITKSLDVQENWKGGIQDLLNTIKKLQLENSLQYLVRLLMSILNGEWWLYQTNMSEVLEIVMKMEPPANKIIIKEILGLLKGHNENEHL